MRKIELFVDGRKVYEKDHSHTSETKIFLGDAIELINFWKGKNTGACSASILIEEFEKLAKI